MNVSKSLLPLIMTGLLPLLVIAEEPMDGRRLGSNSVLDFGWYVELAEPLSDSLRHPGRRLSCRGCEGDSGSRHWIELQSHADEERQQSQATVVGEQFHDAGHVHRRILPNGANNPGSVPAPGTQYP